jgi:aconitase A
MIPTLPSRGDIIINEGVVPLKLKDNSKREKLGSYLRKRIKKGEQENLKNKKIVKILL